MQMTGDQLIEHRLKQLEEIAVGARATERAVDLLKVEVTAGHSEMSEMRAEMRERDDHTRSSLARIHQRLDAITTEEAREEGAKAERARLGRYVVVAVTLGATVSGAIVGALALILGHIG